MDLRSSFQDELAFLQQLAQEFATDYPELQDLFENFSADPDTNRLFEQFAFLSARLRGKIEDAFPEITQGLLEKVWPLPLRPLPSTTIVAFDAGSGGESRIVPKGAEIKGYSAKGAEYRFQLCRDVLISPLQLLQTRSSHHSEGSVLSLDFKWSGALSTNNLWDTIDISLYLGGSAQNATTLKLWFLQYLEKMSIVIDGQKYALATFIVAQEKSSKENLILPLESEQYWRLQRFVESLFLPQTQQFIHIHLPAELKQIPLPDSKEFTLLFQFNQAIPPEVKLDEATFLLNCVPAINVFETESEIYPPAQKQYQIRVPDATQIYHLSLVYTPIEPNQTGRGDVCHYLPATEFTASHFVDEPLYYYKVLQEQDVVNSIYYQLSFIDNTGKEALLDKPFQCRIQCIDRDEITALNIGDICYCSEDISGELKFRNITQPTRPLPPEISSHHHWEILSHLSLSPLFFNDKEAIKQLLLDLSIYSRQDVSRRKAYQKQLEGLVKIESKPIDYIEKGAIVRGLKIQVTLDLAYFSGVGEMYSFGQILAELFPYGLNDNNLLLLSVINQNSGEEWDFEPIKGSRGQI